MIELLRRGYTRSCAGAGFGALLAALALPAGAGAQIARSDTVSGRVMARDSTPLAYARVTVVRDDGRTFQARAADDGRYLLAVPAAGGRYELTVQALGYVALATTVERPSASGRIIRDFRLNQQVIALDTLRTTPRVVSAGVRKATPGETLEAFSALTTEAFPTDAGDLEALASLAPGTMRLGSTEEGVALSIAGQPAGQTRATLDGAQSSGSQIPSEGVRNIATLTNVYDVAHGQFAGGEIATRTMGGTNHWGGALTVRTFPSFLRYGAPATRSGGQPGQRVLASGGGGGPLLRDRLFAYGAADLMRSEEGGAYFDPEDTSGLRASGIAPDSARRFTQLLNTLGLQHQPRSPDVHRYNGSAFVRLDFTPSEQHSLTTRFDWRGSRAQGLGASRLWAGSGLADQLSRDAGVLAKLTSAGATWSNDLRVNFSSAARHTSSASGGPVGRVRVSSMLDDGTTSPAVLSFGGVSFLPPDEAASLWELANDLKRELGGGTHRVGAGLLLQQQRFSSAETTNRSGTFTFDSLHDLEQGRPASFTRTLAHSASDVARRDIALYLGDTWEPSERAAIIFGLRLDATSYGDRESPLPAVEQLAPRARDAPPAEWFLSPRAGFRYKPGVLGNASLRGGAGAFRGVVSPRILSRIWGETGANDTGVRLTCVGDAAPMPDWHAYTTDPATIPHECDGVEPVLTDRAPSVAVFAPDFASPRTWRASAGLDGNLTARLSYRFDALVVYGQKITTAVDRNLDTGHGFAAPDEGGRSVFARPDQIDARTGLFIPGASRRDQNLGTVREIGSGGESWTRQVSAGVTGVVGKKTAQTLVSLSYTNSHSRDRVGGVPAPGAPAATTAGDPASQEWGPSDLDRRHSFQLILSNRVRPMVQLSAIAQYGSGLPYTPIVTGDVNGDGAYNDRAFVFEPGALPDISATQTMSSLLSSGPDPIRICLRRQLGALAKRNSCRTGWWSSLSAEAQVSPSRFGGSRRLAFSARASNLTAGIDYLLHGPGGLRGWGQYSVPDPYLLEVRGFDREQRSFRYDVNPQFGQPLGRGLLRIPFSVTLQGRVAVGSDPRHQPMAAAVAAGLRSGAGRDAIRRALAERIRNIPAIVLALASADPGELALTADQVVRLRTAADSLAPQLDQALDALTLAFSSGASKGRGERVQDAARAAQAVTDAGLQIVGRTLSREQVQKLPVWLVAPATGEELTRPPPVQMTLPGG